MAGSTLPARALGRLITQHRKRAGMTRYAAAQVVETSQQTMSRIEDGLKAKVPDLWINAWSDAFGCTDEDRRTLLGLAHELRTAQRSWWRAYADEIPTGFDHYLSLEDAAKSLTIWAASLLPGLLQTSDYRRELAWTEDPTWTHDEVERRIGVATNRQERLQDPEFKMNVLLSESVLRTQVGSAAVMEGQLTRLTELSNLPNVTIRVVPFNAARPIGPLVGSFTILEFPQLPATKLQEPPVVYVEGYVGDLYLEREAEVQQFQDAASQIGRVALKPSETRQLVVKVAKEHTQ
ncbi:MAG: helix-turn-helix domain-containing protein [Nocardia sp.]|nr:helix-turn-helix domain-containing protein [Nocardia sp.]